MTKLFYRLDCATLFSEPDQIQGKSEIGSFELKDEVLTIELATECKLITEARQLVIHFLKAWQLEAEIRRLPFLRNFRFAFWKAETKGIVADQTENAPEPLKHEKDDKGSLIFESEVYPPAPITRFTPQIEAAWSRYRKATLGIGEPIQSAAYYLLTIAERTAGGRRKAASYLSIDKAVLSKIGELTSTRGSETTARKMLKSTGKPLTHKEKRWIDSAVRLLLLHLGVLEAGGVTNQLTMDDLPDLGFK